MQPVMVLWKGRDKSAEKPSWWGCWAGQVIRTRNINTTPTQTSYRRRRAEHRLFSSSTILCLRANHLSVVALMAAPRFQLPLPTFVSLSPSSVYARSIVLVERPILCSLMYFSGEQRLGATVSCLTWVSREPDPGYLRLLLGPVPVQFSRRKISRTWLRPLVSFAKIEFR